MNSESPHSYVAVVDDDESSCRSMSRLLRAGGFQTITYPSAEAFLADRKHPQFDCLVLDIRLGGMSGIELRKRLQAVSRDVPVVFVTAYDSPEIREEAHRAGCSGYFRKTDPGSEILSAIRTATS
jgi:FixJ family two-component response regulator